MTNHGLSKSQLEIIKNILVPFSQKISRVALFGSRATGLYRPNSDIDLVLYGDIEEKTVDCIWTHFAESSLPVKVDVLAYNLLTYAPLKMHIDNVNRPIFFHKDFQKHL